MECKKGARRESQQRCRGRNQGECQRNSAGLQQKKYRKNEGKLSKPEENNGKIKENWRKEPKIQQKKRKNKGKLSKPEENKGKIKEN